MSRDPSRRHVLLLNFLLGAAEDAVALARSGKWGEGERRWWELLNGCDTIVFMVVSIYNILFVRYVIEEFLTVFVSKENVGSRRCDDGSGCSDVMRHLCAVVLVELIAVVV